MLPKSVFCAKSVITVAPYMCTVRAQNIGTKMGIVQSSVYTTPRSMPQIF